MDPRTLLWIGASTLATGCYTGYDAGVGGDGGIASEGLDPSEDTAGEGETAGESGEDPADDPDDAPEGLNCAERPLSAGSSPLRRLTRLEYNATIHDLLGDDSAIADTFVADEIRFGFPSREAAVDKLAVDQYRLAAQTIADTTARAQLDDWMDCDRADEGCVEPFIEDFGGRAFRRPLTEDERTAYLGLYQSGRDDGDPDAGVLLAIQTLLMSPHFLYHVERGEPDASGTVALTPFERASRLSYFLWGSMPDASLFAAAAAGELESEAQLEAQARRMLDSERATEQIVTFASHWLDITELDQAIRDETVFPDWDPALVEAMREETERFVTGVILQGDGRLETLLTADFSYVEDEGLAALYGVTAAPSGTRTVLPGERSGILTQGSVLVSHAYPTKPSWVHRGKLIRERLLCGEMPPPPEDIEFEDPNDPSRLDNPVCAACHLLMDPIGWAFDGYDATGRFVGGENPGEVNFSDIGAFETIPQLGRELAADDVVRHCVADQVARFALARGLDSDLDECNREAIYEAFAASDYDLRELMVVVATSDAFTHLNVESE